ncbi:MAG: DUF5683 domain-containing protein [Ignavibacteriales bacterium]
MRRILALIFILSITGSMFAQKKDTLSNKFTGNLLADSKIALNNYEKNITPVSAGIEGKKSPLLAGFFSLLVPGAGEAYSQSYWKAAAFLAVEAAAIYATVYYNKKGEDATADFQRYANENWSAVRYAQWLNRFAADVSAGAKSNIRIDPDGNKPPWERVDFSEINSVERQIATFSHVLPSYGDQQYYELIGKYHQFNHGWAQSDPNTAEYLNNLPQQMLDYARMHIKPDDTYYKYSSRAVVVLVVNHFLSALDAAWSASRYNKSLAVNMELKQVNMVGMLDLHPQLNLKYNF